MGPGYSMTAEPAAEVEAEVAGAVEQVSGSEEVSVGLYLVG